MQPADTSRKVDTSRPLLDQLPEATVVPTQGRGKGAGHVRRCHVADNIDEPPHIQPRFLCRLVGIRRGVFLVQVHKRQQRRVALARELGWKLLPLSHVVRLDVRIHPRMKSGADI